jgi:hypothetical protein
VDRIFDHAKRSDHTLADAEIEALIEEARAPR